MSRSFDDANGTTATLTAPVLDDAQGDESDLSPEVLEVLKEDVRRRGRGGARTNEVDQIEGFLDLTSDPVVGLEQHEVLDVLFEQVRTLPSRAAAIFNSWLNCGCIGDRSFKEVAKQHHCNPKRVQWVVCGTLERLRANPAVQNALS